MQPYSGWNNAPKYGDFECHRHWMEVTHNLPIEKWYTESEHNNSTYWPIDYPPLCAYYHYAFSQIIALIEPQAIKLGQSNGY